MNRTLIAVLSIIVGGLGLYGASLLSGRDDWPGLILSAAIVTVSFALLAFAIILVLSDRS